MTDTAHRVIGRYEILRPIGAGGMGVLWLARDPMIDRRVAIKLMREGVESASSRERFLREARSAGRLHHPNIVTIFDVGEHEGQPFIAMQYIEGETLADIVNRRAAVSVVRKLRWIEDLCAGLHYAHRAGIVHRDIKPANVMVGEDGILRVLDFGIARLGPAGLTQGGVIGTLNYMAPEQLEGLPIDARADIFALGALFYEVLAYEPAFSGGIEEGILAKILYRDPEPLERIVADIDAELVGIVSRCLAKKPDNRYPDCLALAQDVAAIRLRLAPRFGSTGLDTSAPEIATPSGEETATPDETARPAFDPLLVEPTLVRESSSPDAVVTRGAEFHVETEVAGATTIYGDEPNAPAPSMRRAVWRVRSAAALAMLALAGALWLLPRAWRSRLEPNAPAVDAPVSNVAESPQPTSTPSPTPPPADVRPPAAAANPSLDPAAPSRDSGRGQPSTIAAPSAAPSSPAAATASPAAVGPSRPETPEPRPAPPPAVPVDSGLPSGSALGRSEPPPSVPPAPAPTAASNVPTEAERGATARAADETAVRAVLAEYKAAYERLDAAGVKRVMPTLTAAQERLLADQFRAFKSYTLQFQNVAVSLASTTATVRCRIARTAVPKAGRTLANANEASLELQKEGTAWVITKLSDAVSR